MDSIKQVNINHCLQITALMLIKLIHTRTLPIKVNEDAIIYRLLKFSTIKQN